MADFSTRVLADRYELRSRVGASAGTEVYLAYDRELGRDVAVKMLTPAAAAQPDVADRFRRMATMAASLRAPNVVGVFDVAESADGPFLVMEYVDGANLADVERGARLEVRRAAGIGEGVAMALAAAHRAGVVHGSLTPRDVLLARDGTVKVTDFGTATAGLASLGDQTATALYQAPEQLQG